MKVGIITLFDSENLGNRLQNYALQQVLLEYADEVVTIKNKPAFKSLGQKIMRSSFLAESVVANRLAGKNRKVRMLAFNKQYIRITSKSYCCDDDNVTLRPQDCCDLYCAGSDQIWNPNLGRWRSFNFLGFAKPDATFSYAASFGIDEIPQSHEAPVRKGLQHMKHISVREAAGGQIVEKLTGRTDAQVVIDPTMLVDVGTWDAIAKKPQKMCSGDYMLAYFLGGMPPARRQEIEAYARNEGLTLIDILDQNGPMYEIGPAEFVYLIRNARRVCTDSFHASVFSFLYHRPLAIFPRAGKNINMNSRIETLAATFGLEDSICTHEKMPDLPAEVDYTAGEAVLRQEREKARSYLDTVFKRVKT